MCELHAGTVRPMYRLLVVVVLVACAGPQAQRIPADPPAGLAAAPAEAPAAVQPPVPAAAPQISPKLDDPAVFAQSHAWFDAVDRHDSAAVLEPLGPTFVLFEDARFYDRALLATVIKGRADKGIPSRTRKWDDEHVFSSAGTAVFVGHAVETVPAFGENAATTEDGYNTLVWVHDGSRWVIAHHQWVRAGIEVERQRWNDAYRMARGFNKKPNQLLVDTLKGKKPGTAIDIAMGQGRNAIYIASQGWKTTGIDISDEGIRQAKAEAVKQKLKLEALLADVDNYDFGKAKWDLVTLIYSGDDAKLVERIKPALKKGGLFVCEYFHAESDVAKAGAGGWDTGELAGLFKDGFEILRDEVVDDNADWASQRKTKLVRFVARKK